MRLLERLYLVGSGSWGLNLTDDLDCHVYLLDGGSEAALIDAGGGRNIDLILKNIEDDGIPLHRVRTLLLTHGHADHAAGAAGLREALGLQVCAAQELMESLAVGDGWGISLGQAKAAGLYPADFVFRPCHVDVELKDGQTIPVGDCTLKVIETPGH
ncbi:MAG: MBL fold metallo-hydrolase, partial [Anaerolineae bacterium]